MHLKVGFGNGAEGVGGGGGENKHCHIQSTLVISKSKGLYETLRDIRTSTYQFCGTEENN